MIYILSIIVYLFISLHKLEVFSSSPAKLHFEGLVYLLIYIRDKKNLGLKYYSKIEVAPLSDILRQASIKTENQLIVLSGSSWKECSYNVRSTRAYILFDQGGPIDYCTDVPGPVVTYSSESEYNAACTAGMYLAHFRILNNDLLDKDTDVVS